VISEIRVRNFKCFAALDLPLAPLTLLTGVNNTGKSTVLQSLLLLRQSHLAGEIERDGLALNGDLVRLGTADMLVREDETRMELGLDWSDGATVGFAYEVKTDLRGALRESRSTKDPVSLLASVSRPDRKHYESRTPFTACRYVSADRTGPRAAFSTSEAVVVGARDVGATGEFAAHYLFHYGGAQANVDVHHPSAATRMLRHEVEAWLGLLSSDVQVLAELYEALDVCGLTFTFPGGQAGRTKPQRSTHVGFGLTYMLPILVAILSANPGDLVMIENPEAHLHPRAQREIAQLLARAAGGGVQVLVETHSDHVLNGIRFAVKKGTLGPRDVRVHFFTPTEPRLVSPEIQADGSIHEWPSGFFDEWDLALDELLQG